MKLKYRGAQYQSETSLLEMKESDITGKYRGNERKYKLPRHVPQLRPKFGLNYRGVAYSTCPNMIPAMTTNSETPLKVISPHSCIAHPVAKSTLEQLHLENLRQNLERRIKLAQQAQNHCLLEMLEKESQQLAI
jgi:hypothetical protein